MITSYAMEGKKSVLLDLANYVDGVQLHVMLTIAQYLSYLCSPISILYM